jgi:hypothetical protein
MLFYLKEFKGYWCLHDVLILVFSKASTRKVHSSSWKPTLHNDHNRQEQKVVFQYFLNNFIAVFGAVLKLMFSCLI